jgi:outer membrane protein assembly factor BamD
MKFINKLVLSLILLSLISCSKNKEEISTIKEQGQELEMVSAYREGMKALNANDTFYAAKKFLEAELLFPQSSWAAKSALMAAYAYYMQDYYSEAQFNLERYLTTYPLDENRGYAEYLLAICYYEGIVDEKRDLAPLLISKKKFQFILKEYSETDFALDAKYKIDLINDILASKETYLGRHYIKKKKWIPAINRFKNVITHYDDTIYAEEAIHRLVEIHYRIGLIEESKKYASLLGYNYLSGEWYKKSYKIFNKNYKTKKPEKIKKDKKKIFSKFKKLFE